MKVISGSFTITAVEDGENAVTYEILDNGSRFKYDPNTKKVDMQVSGTLYKIEGTKRTPMAGYQIFINDDGNIINDNANDGNYLTTKTDGSFSYTADSDWVNLLSQSTKIHAGFYTNDVLVAVLNIQKITDGENGKDGENAEIYEIMPTSAYFTQSGEGWVNGGFEGQLVKVVGKDRYGIEGATVEMVYTENNGDIYIEETTTTDSQGYFAFTDQIDGGWEDYGYTNAFSVRYVINQGIVAERTVSLAKSGMKGERGAPLRISYWAEGWTYYTGKNANDPYTDVVIVGDNYYLCMSNHIATSSNKPSENSTNKTFWEKSSKIDMVATEVLLADNAHINLLSSNSINVNDSSGKQTAGLSGGDGVQLWGGGERDTAKFRVYDDGDVFIEGTVKATNFYHGLRYVQGGEDYEYIRTIYTEDIVIVNAVGWTSNGNPASDATVYEGYDQPLYENNIVLPHPSDVVGKLITIYNRASGNEDMKPYLVAAQKEGVNNDNMFGSLEDYYPIAGKSKVEVLAEQVGSNYYWVVLE